MRERKEFDAMPSLAGVRDEREIRKRKRRDERVEREERGDASPSLIIVEA
jgi:hypothetical protein